MAGQSNSLSHDQQSVRYCVGPVNWSAATNVQKIQSLASCTEKPLESFKKGEFDSGLLVFQRIRVGFLPARRDGDPEAIKSGKKPGRVACWLAGWLASDSADGPRGGRAGGRSVRKASKASSTREVIHSPVARAAISIRYSASLPCCTPAAAPVESPEHSFSRYSPISISVLSPSFLLFSFFLSSFLYIASHHCHHSRTFAFQITRGQIRRRAHSKIVRARSLCSAMGKEKTGRPHGGALAIRPFRRREHNATLDVFTGFSFFVSFHRYFRSLPSCPSSSSSSSFSFSLHPSSVSSH